MHFSEKMEICFDLSGVSRSRRRELSVALKAQSSATYLQILKSPEVSSPFSTHFNKSCQF